MLATKDLVSTLDAAIGSAEEEYRLAVIGLAIAELKKPFSTEREPANIDKVHHVRTRVIALHAARDQLTKSLAEEQV